MATLRRAVLRAAMLGALAAPLPRPLAAQVSTYQLLQTFSDLLNQIRVNYVDSVTTYHLVRGAIEGMLASLDPHSYFQEHRLSSRLDAWHAGLLGWTGIYVGEEEGAVVVMSVASGSPAERAHVSPGDRIKAVNDTVVAGLRAPDVQARLVGEDGSKVRIRLERGSRLQPDTATVTVKNADIREISVSRARTLAGGVGYVRLEEFLEHSGEEVSDAIERVSRRPAPRRIILDLRDNPGGLVDAAMDVLSLFLRDGQVAFRVEGRHPGANATHVVHHDGRYSADRIVLLIDEWSGSASEIVAGSLQDHDRALILGRRSFGKALVQQPFYVQPAGDLVMLTIAHVVTPSGRVVQRRYEGLTVEQYYALAGKGGNAEDTTTTFKTDSGRIVRGGGGIAPDSTLPAPAPPPAWFVAASDSNLDYAVADSVAAALPSGSEAAAWIGDSAHWTARLLPSLLDRVRKQFGVAPRLDAEPAARIARFLAARVAEVRWGKEARQDLLLATDPDVAAAVAVLNRPFAPAR